MIFILFFISSLSPSLLTTQPAKVRQRFVVRPKTKHITCMKSIPGVVEESKDFVDSANLTSSTSWVETSFLQTRGQSDYLTQSMDLTGRNRLRPMSAPNRRKTVSGDCMVSTRDLSIYSEPGSLEFFSPNGVGTRGMYCMSCKSTVLLYIGNPPFSIHTWN